MAVKFYAFCFCSVIFQCIVLSLQNMEENVHDIGILSSLEPDTTTESLNPIFFPIAPSNCSKELEKFSSKISSFTVCAIRNCRPISICKGCVQQMNDTQNIYTGLKERPELESCRQLFFGSDKLSIVDILYNDAKSLWMSSHCDSCYRDANFNTNYSSFSEETVKFFNALEELDECISITKTRKNDTCARCDYLYSALNKVYQSIVDENKNTDGVCMDVVDAMNITRHLWNDKFNCVHYDTSIGVPNVLMALIIGSMPLIFYLMSRSIAIIEDIKLVQPKRKNSRHTANPQ